MTAQATTESSELRQRDRALYRDLKSELRAAGCFAPAPLRQAAHMAAVLALFAAGYFVLLTGPGPGPRITALLLLAFASVQAGFIAHEAGHGAILRRRRAAAAIGQLFNTLLTALSYAHFQKIHTCHHAHTNERARDVDMQSGLFSLYPQAAVEKSTWIGRWVTRHQGWLIWPLVSLQAFSLKWDSLRTLAADPAGTRVDQAMLVGHAALWLALPAAVLGPVDALVNYGLLTWFIGPYLGVVFLVNHVGTHVVEPDDAIGPFAQRLATTRDLGDSWLAGVFFGGINHHVEHHLFPTLPGARLRRARDVTRAFCRRHGLVYRETGWWRAAAEVSAYLRDIGRLAAPAAR